MYHGHMSISMFIMLIPMFRCVSSPATASQSVQTSANVLISISSWTSIQLDECPLASS